MNFTYAESFAGIGAWGKALKTVTERHGDTTELKYYFEIDKYASNAYSAIHDVPEELNNWDITKHVKVPEVDVFFYSPPCQTFSIAGKKEGRTVAKGNLFDSAIEKLIQSKPKFAIMENVANLANQFKKDFQDMIADLEKAGYYNYFKVLNSKNYGIPQNRERIFIVSVRKDIYDSGFRFEFPSEIDLTTRLKDFVNEEVDEKYFLSEKMVDFFTKHTEDMKKKGNGFAFTPNDVTGIAKSITTRSGQRMDDNFLLVPSATDCGYELASEGDSINLDQMDSATRRGRVGKQVAQTLTTSCNQAVVMQIGNLIETDSFGGNPQRGRIYGTEGICPALTAMQGGGLAPNILTPCIAASRGRNPENPSDRTTGAPMEQRFEINENGTSNAITSVQKDNLLITSGMRIRKLQPKEAWRLQGFQDADYSKAVTAYEKKWKPGRSDSQMYIRAGNTITVNVIVELLENLLYQRKQESQLTMF